MSSVTFYNYVKTPLLLEVEVGFVYGLHFSFRGVFCIKKAGSLGLERTCEGGKLHHVSTYIIQYLSIVVKTKS
ncbi:hypothetical protein CTV99_16425 [Bacillus pumilus]|uniref:Uncharacterized protein n=1 Tax=Bacillus pumilus TaxID=1408 RepID=A0A2G8IQ86_BACPU|nr:hypothetical protein CTV99_16425 [Bacillus pumilus]